jgi:tetratricopeptide (TPR) repeat protein
LEAQDLQGLLALLRARWTSDQIKQVLSSEHADARKVACLALGLVGARCCITPLADQLRDPDPMANGMAEHALWSIWFRCGSQKANQLLTDGAAAMDDRDFERAEKLFTAAIQADPDFAEAYNQRAIVRYLMERYEPSIADCREAVKRMPCHFGAWAGMGHGHAHLGQTSEAILCYQKALEINPHLECIAEAVKELRRQQGNGHCRE